MQVNSLVAYVGGQDVGGRKIYPLSREAVYTVSNVCHGKFSDGIKPAVKLAEAGDVWAFDSKMFAEIDPPVNINIDEILNQEHVYTQQPNH